MQVDTRNNYEKIEPATASKMTTNILYDRFQPHCHDENAKQIAADPSDTSKMTVNILYDGYQSAQNAGNHNDAAYEEVADFTSSNESSERTVNILYHNEFSKSISLQNETEINSTYEFADDTEAEKLSDQEKAKNLTANILCDDFQPEEKV